MVFRADAAFAKPELCEALEERDVKYAFRLPANDKLERYVVELLTRPVGRPSYRPVVRFKSFLYQAASWIGRDGWWRRSSSTLGSCCRASASS